MVYPKGGTLFSFIKRMMFILPLIRPSKYIEYISFENMIPSENVNEDLIYIKDPGKTSGLESRLLVTEDTEMGR